MGSLLINLWLGCFAALGVTVFTVGLLAYLSRPFRWLLLWFMVWLLL